jgi:hypothetical protein
LISKRIRIALLSLAGALALAACGEAPRRDGGAAGDPAVSAAEANSATTAPERGVRADGAGVSTATGQPGALAGVGDSGPPVPPVTLFVIRRSWHTDIGFEVADLQPPLAALHSALPEARYLLFGFGDKHYLMTHAGGIDRLWGAIWPGDGLVLLTGLEATPEEAFGAQEVVRLVVSASQAQALEEFVWHTLATRNGAAQLLAPGPYAGSLYYAAALRYSGLHTCNTWTAEGLRAAGLPVRTFGVEFSGQVWRQVKHLSATH